MNNKEIVNDLTNRVSNEMLYGFHSTWEDFCVEMRIRDPARPFDGIVVWGETNDNGDKFFSVSLRKGLRDNDPGTEIVKRFSDSFSTEDLEKAVIDVLLASELNRSNQPVPEKEELRDRFLRINGQEFSFDEVARALGLDVSPELEPVQVALCQRVDSGVLVAKGSFFDHDDYPGIDLELQLPAEQDSMPIMISRTEQPRLEGESHNLRTFGYSRENEYFMFFDSDLRPDAEVDQEPRDQALTVSGDRWRSVEVFAENPYIEYKGYSAPALKESLESKIQSAVSRSADGLPSEKEHLITHSR